MKHNNCFDHREMSNVEKMVSISLKYISIPDQLLDVTTYHAEVNLYC